MVKEKKVYRVDFFPGVNYASCYVAAISFGQAARIVHSITESQIMSITELDYNLLVDFD